MSVFQLLKTKLQDTLIYAHSSHRSFQLESVEALEENTEFSANTLYISTEERAIAYLQRKKGELSPAPVLFLVSAEVSKNFLLQKLCEKYEVSVIMSRRSISELYLAAAQTCQYYLNMAESADKLSKIKNISALLGNISDFVQENLVLTNANGNILYEIGEVTSSTKEQIRNSFTEIFFRDSVDNFEATEEADAQSIVLNYVKLYKPSSVIGVLFIENTNQKAHDLERFFQKLSPSISEFLVSDINSRKSIQAKFDYIWTDIMEGRYSSSQDIKNIFDHSGLKTKEFYRIVVIQVHELANKIQQIYGELVPQIQEILPECNVTMYLSNIVIFNWEEEREYGIPETISQLEPMLRQYHCRACCSWSSRNLSWLPLIFDSCTQELRLEQQLKKSSDTSTLISFGDYSPYLLIDMCAQYARNMKHTRNIMMLTHPAIINLYRYDQEHRTNLEEVLYYYLVNHRSLELTAQSLYMHRNTVVNKLRKIRQLIPIDLDAPEIQGHLILSHFILEYCIKVIDNNYLYRDHSDD